MLHHEQFLSGFRRHLFLRRLRRGLCAPTREARAEAIHMLVSLGDKRGVHCALRGNADPWIRSQAARGLAQLLGANSARALARALKDDSLEVARAAAEGLAHLQGHGVARALRYCIGSDDWMVRFFGVRGLARIASPAVIPWLTRLRCDEHPSVREEVAQALQRLSVPGASNAKTPAAS